MGKYEHKGTITRFGKALPNPPKRDKSKKYILYKREREILDWYTQRMVRTVDYWVRYGRESKYPPESEIQVLGVYTSPTQANAVLRLLEAANNG